MRVPRPCVLTGRHDSLLNDSHGDTEKTGKRFSAVVVAVRGINFRPSVQAARTTRFACGLNFLAASVRAFGFLIARHFADWDGGTRPSRRKRERCGDATVPGLQLNLVDGGNGFAAAESCSLT